MLLLNSDGEIVLTLTFGDHSAAKLLHSASTEDLHIDIEA